MGINTSAIQEYITWRNNLTPEDYPLIFASLAKLDEVETLVMSGADHDTIRRAVFELD